MTREEAQEILAIIDTNLEPELTPEVEAAFELLSRDPELQAWYEEQRAFDDVVASALMSSEVARPSSSALCPRMRVKRRRHQILWVGLACAAAVLLSVWIFMPRETYLGPQTEISAAAPAQFEDLRDFVAVYVANGFSLQKKTKDPQVAQDWLQDQAAPVAPLGRVLAGYKSMGCRTISWRGDVVSLLCFVGPDGDYIHLFRMNREACAPTGLLANQAIRKACIDRETAAWDIGDTVCILVAHKPGQTLPPDLS